MKAAAFAGQGKQVLMAAVQVPGNGLFRIRTPETLLLTEMIITDPHRTSTIVFCAVLDALLMLEAKQLLCVVMEDPVDLRWW